MNSLLFGGIEGSNPLGFLAAVGAWRLSALLWGDEVRMRWIRRGGWRPELAGAPVADEAEFCQALCEMAPWAPLDVFAPLGRNLTVAPETFGPVARAAAAGATRDDRRAADFVAAFGSDVLADQKSGRIRYTDLCFITGSGHQDFLGTASGLRESTGTEHLREALFGPWGYRDRGLSLRWDPGDAKEYALQWENPSSVGVYSVWGANRLAFEALPLFPAAATGGARSGVRTTGFETRGRVHEFTWPMWEAWIGLDAARGLFASRMLQEEAPERGVLQAIGLAEIFRCQRVRIGQGANFKVSFRPARSV
jgi:hypothetical protein